ncbi:unnamed protein product [Rotaria sp. Silwood1]|nr:unnamed protein product [Rotaria sp. Silwood1]
MNSQEREAVFKNMVDLYKETWKGKSKPFKINDPKLLNKYNLNESNGEIQANRFTTSQPIEFVDANGRIQFNRRKLNELPQFLSQLTTNLAIPIIAQEVVFNYTFMRAKIACAAFNDIINDFQKFTESSSYSLSDEVKAIKSEIKIFSMLYLIVGIQLQQYPDNFAFEVSSRLLSLFGIKPFITNLIKQIDEQSVRYCSLIVPYCQLQSPGSGLIFSMNRHTTSIVDFDFTEDQMKAITLSDRIIVIDMGEVRTVLDINLPNLNEPYLNSTTLPETYTFDGKNEIKDARSSNSSNDEFKRYLFLVNSLHHIYLVSANENIKFEHSSKVGYLTVEMLDKRRALCVVAERNTNYVECWDVVRKRLFDRFEFSKVKVKYVLCAQVYSMIIIVLQDGIIQFYSITDWTKSSFVHRGLIHAGIHLELVAVTGGMLIHTFNANIPIDFALISLKQFHKTEQILSDKQVFKTLVAFDPPMGPKPIKSIILPDTESMSFDDIQSNFPFFMTKTRDAIFIVHKCNNKDISYIRINGRFDVVSMHAKNSHTLYTARGGIVELHKWACIESKDCNSRNHKYQLYVSIDISSSPITSIKAKAGNASLFVCALENGVFQVYYASHAREAFKNMPSFPRTNEVIRTVQLLNKTAITLDSTQRELTSWSYQYAPSIHSTRSFLDDVTINEFAIASNNLNSEMIFVLILTTNHWIEIYSAKSLNDDALYSLHLRSPARVHSTINGNFYVLTCNGIVYSIAQQIASNNEFNFNQKTNSQLKIPCSMMLSSVLTLNGLESLIVFADNGQSMAICTMKRVIYIDVDVSSYISSSSLKSITSEKTQNLLLLYFNNKTLISCQVKLDESNEKGSLQFTPFDQADKFCLQNNCLATYNNGKTQLNLHDIRSSTCYEPIQLDSECQYLCFNESATYVFALVKPRVLFMYRMTDHRQMAKLFVYDFVSSMVADNDFLVLAMNDRRLLTLMIADPDDPTLQARIHALPSRNPQRLSKSATKRLVDHVEKCGNMSSSDEDESDLDHDDNDKTSQQSKQKKNDQTNVQKLASPTSLFRIVTRLNARHSLSKMRNDEEIRSQIMTISLDNSEALDMTKMINNSDDENYDDNNAVQVPDFAINTDEHKNIDADLNDIRQKTLEFNQNQIKGIQFANAGDRNLKIVNNHAITSSTCSIT